MGAPILSSSNVRAPIQGASYGFYFRGCAEAYPAVIERRHFQCLKCAWVNCYIVPYVFTEPKDDSHCWLHTTYVFRTHAPCVRTCQSLISSVSSVLLSKTNCSSFILLCFCWKVCWMRTHAPCVPTFQLKFRTCQMLIPSVSSVLLSKTNWRSFILLFFCLNPPP